QEIKISAHQVRYRRERWKTVDGEEILGELPEEVKGYHFGPSLRQFVLYQYFHNHVTQPLLLNQLRELGISISTGQLSNLLVQNKDTWKVEKEHLLKEGLKHCQYIQVDDTGARHQGRNIFCTQIGNNQFTYFKTTDTKSKHNFLSILQGSNQGYRFNGYAVDYLSTKAQFSNFDLMRVKISQTLGDLVDYNDANELLNYIRCENYLKASTKHLMEAAMIGYLKQEVMADNLIILSDEAKQFNIEQNAA
ncbi:transposase, partial [Aliikangiella sp. GXAS 311]